jgi:hypothetical protein
MPGGGSISRRGGRCGTAGRGGFGHVSEQVEARLIVDTVPPRFLAVSPSDGTVVRTPQVNIAVTVDDPFASVVIEGIGAASALTTGGLGVEFSRTVPLVPGPNDIRVTALDHAGNAGTAVIRVTYAAVGLSIDSPGDNAIIDGDSVIVSGTFQGPANTGINVNGTLAGITGDRFMAQIPLQPGQNLITVTATTADGGSVRATRAVTASGSSSLAVTAEPPEGIAPVRVVFTLATRDGTPLKRIEADFDGNGVADFVTTSPASVTIANRYRTPGAFLAKFSATDTGNVVHQQAVLVVVHDADQLDATIKAIWAGMTQALTEGDARRAESFLTGVARGKFGPVFEALLPDMDRIVSSWSPLLRSWLIPGLAEYAVVRPQGDHHAVHLIYFTVGEDGIWRIDEM